MEALNIQLSPFFQWLLQTSLQGSLLICLILLVKSILRGKLPIRWHYYLWILLLVRLALPWAPQSRFSVFNLVPQYSSPKRGETTLTAESTVDTKSHTTANSETTKDTTEHTITEHQAVQPKPVIPESELKSTSAPAVPEALSPDRNDSTHFVSLWIVRILPLAWLFGAIALGGYVAVRNFHLWRTIKCERPITGSEILELLEDCKMQMNVQTIVGVIVTDTVKSPALFGFIRPRLLLPQGLIEAFDFEELRYIFLHELAHLKRRDIYLGWLVSLLQIMHWFNPLIWFALRRMRTDQELACDGLVLSTMKTDELPKYGSTIINLFERFSQVSYVPSLAGILEDTSQLERRIKMITNPERKSRAHSAGAIFLLVALSCIALTDAHQTHSTVDSLDCKVPASLHRNVLLYLSFDRDGGTRVVDISGMDFHGELHGGEYTEDGHLGGAMNFDGVDDHISISGVKLHAFTFSAWVKTQTGSINNQRLFLLDNGEQYYAVQGTSRGDVELSGAGFEHDNPEPISKREFVVNEWTYVTAAFDGEVFKVYKNGILIRSGRNIHKGLTGTAYLGGTEKYHGRFWHGAMDEVAIFNRALNASEIRELYSMTEGLDQESNVLATGTPVLNRNGLVLYYSFDNNRGLTVTDQSGQGHYGTVHGASYESNGKVGGAMSFDGDDDYISTSDISLREFTFSAWIKTNTGRLNNRRIFLLSDGKHCYALQTNVGGSVGIYIADDVEINEYDWSFSFGKWTHITVTHDGSIFKIYRDGKLTEVGHIETSGVKGTLYIGGTDKHRGGFWQGMIDELFIFNRTLSDLEVERLYSSAIGAGDVPLPTRSEPLSDIISEDARGQSDFKGIWSGMAVDKPNEGTSRDSLKLELSVDKSGSLTGVASGEFVRGRHSEVKNLKISGNRILFEVAHRIANLRMGVTLELRDGLLKGEALPIDFDENSCDIVLRREASQ